MFVPFSFPRLKKLKQPKENSWKSLHFPLGMKLNVWGVKWLSRHSVWNRNEKTKNLWVFWSPISRIARRFLLLITIKRDKNKVISRASGQQCVPAWLVNVKCAARAEFLQMANEKLSSILTIARCPIDQSSLSLNNCLTAEAEKYTGKVFERFEPQTHAASYYGRRVLIGLFAQTMHISNTAICREINCPNTRLRAKLEASHMEIENLWIPSNLYTA